MFLPGRAQAKASRTHAILRVFRLGKLGFKTPHRAQNFKRHELVNKIGATCRHASRDIGKNL